MWCPLFVVDPLDNMFAASCRQEGPIEAMGEEGHGAPSLVIVPRDRTGIDVVDRPLLIKKGWGWVEWLSNFLAQGNDGFGEIDGINKDP